MVNIFKLGYVDFHTDDVEAMVDYYTNIMGFTVVERESNGTTYISSGLDHHNIVITLSKNKRMNGFGLQLSGNKSLEEVSVELKDHWVNHVIIKDAKPGIEEYIELSDPDGNLIHLYQNMETPAPGFKKDGIIPQKLGHIAFGVKDHKKVIEFYNEVLGFWNTDWIGDVGNFMTCNQDHHVLNVLGIGKSKLHHIAFELKDASHHVLSGDYLAKNNIPVLWGPTRHTAGHNIASYHHDPDKHLVELYTDLDVYSPELGYMEPRPWHLDLPQKPKVWDDLSYWKTPAGFDLAKV